MVRKYYCLAVKHVVKCVETSLNAAGDKGVVVSVKLPDGCLNDLKPGEFVELFKGVEVEKLTVYSG